MGDSDHFISCDSHWSTWDSLYTLSEDEFEDSEDIEDDNAKYLVTSTSTNNISDVGHGYCLYCKVIGINKSGLIIQNILIIFSSLSFIILCSGKR